MPSDKKETDHEHHRYRRRLNAPYGARYFLTNGHEGDPPARGFLPGGLAATLMPIISLFRELVECLNAPCGARCFLTVEQLNVTWVALRSS